MGKDYRTAPLMQLQREFPWLYYNALEEGYKCKMCQLFPESSVGPRGKNKFKFGHKAVKSLSNYPSRILKIHDTSGKQDYAIRQYEEFKLRHTLETLHKQKEANKLRESEVTELALEKLMKITVFMVRKFWAHYEEL
jgi:hypothetical protein